MTSKRAWQTLEQRVCAKLGGRRTPLSGSNSQHGTSADCIETAYPWLYIEVKLRACFLHHTIFKQAAKAAQKESKTPILVTHVKNEESELVTLRIEDFLEIIEKGRITDNFLKHTEEGCLKIRNESEKFAVTMKLERKNEAK